MALSAGNVLEQEWFDDGWDEALDAVLEPIAEWAHDKGVSFVDTEELKHLIDKLYKDKTRRDKG